MGKSLKKYETRGCDIGNYQKSNYSKIGLSVKDFCFNFLFVQDKVMSGCGTWIDWQYLFDSAKLLAKCRYTLQYTYPYAYYIEPCPRKELVR